MLSDHVCCKAQSFSSRILRRISLRDREPSSPSECTISKQEEITDVHVKRREKRTNNRARKNSEIGHESVGPNAETFTESTSGLLTLPPEIRTAILEYLVQNHPQVVTVKFIEINDPKALGLLHTNPDTRNAQGIRSGLILRSCRKRVTGSQDQYRRYGSKDRLSTLHSPLVLKQSTSVIPVLLTCKMLYLETLPLLFAHTTFIAHGSRITYGNEKRASPQALLALTWLIGEKNATLIRSLRLDFHLTLEKASLTYPVRLTNSDSNHVKLSGLDFPDPILMALCLQRLKGLRRLELNARVVVSHLWAPKPGLTICGKEAIEAFKPVVAWTRSLENCELVVNVRKSGLQWDELGSRKEQIEDTQFWCKQMEDRLLHLYPPVEVNEKRTQEDAIVTYRNLLHVDAAEVGPFNRKTKTGKAHYSSRLFSDQWTKLCRQALGFSSSKDFVYLEQTATDGGRLVT